jgi:hypothetical protein
VKEVVFDKVYIRGGKSLGFCPFKASLQPNGFFYQCLSDFPYGRSYIYCESIDKYWQITSNEIDVASKQLSQGASETNRLKIVCADMKQHLVDVLNLGIEGLDNKTITWTSQNEFTSPLLDWIGKPTSGKIQVKIESFYQNLPASLRCISTTEKGRQQYEIIFRYDQPVLPPREIIIKKSINGNMLYFTNVIHNITFGLREDAIQGFMPSNFFPGNLVPVRFIVESNGFAYVANNGVRQLIDQSGVGVSVPHNSLYNRVGFIQVVFFVLLLFLPVTLLHKGAKGEKME